MAVETIIAAVALATTAGIGAYNAYASQDYQGHQLELQAEALRNQGILTEAEKKVAEAKINAITGAATRTVSDANQTVTDLVTGQSTTSPNGAGPPGTTTDWQTLLVYAGALLLGWLLLKAILRSR